MIPYLEELYSKYNIHNLKHGRRGDALGDLYEEIVLDCFDKDKSQDIHFLQNIRKQILSNYNVDSQKIKSIDATSKIKLRPNGGLPKTDVAAKITMTDNSIHNLKISVKQTSASKVAIAEYDVDTIFYEVGINKNKENLLYQLMLKHQTDASAKNFTEKEKEDLTNLLQPYKKLFLRWIFTMDPNINKEDIRVPDSIIIFKVDKESNGSHYINHCFYKIEEYIKSKSKNKNNKPTKSGFGTGLSWTYATGSKGKKIQFKG